MRSDINNISFELMEVNGIEVLFTCERIDRSTLPSGLYAYEIRSDGSGCFDDATIENYVIVNHEGTILSKTEIKLNQLGFCVIEDYNFIGEESTIESYCSALC